MLRAQKLAERQARMRAKIRETAELLSLDAEIGEALSGLAEVRVGQRPRRVRRRILIVNSAVANAVAQEQKQQEQESEN